MGPRSAALALVAALFASGCIALPEDLDATDASRLRMPQDRSGTMTAADHVEDQTRLCLTGASFTLGTLPVYCATRTTFVEGEMTLAGLPFDIRSDVGDIQVTTSSAGRWSLLVTVTASDATDDAARARLDETLVSWSIDDGGEPNLRVEAVHRRQDDFQRNAIRIEVALPRDAVYAGSVSTATGDVAVAGLAFERLQPSTSTGDVDVSDVRASRLDASSSTGTLSLAGIFGELHASSSTGDQHVDAEAEDVELSTSTGSITATLRPNASGRIAASASTGDVHLALPEDARRGYQIEAETSTGEARIDLQDGEGTRSKDGDEASFETHGFSHRAVRTTVSLGASTGDVVVTAA